ncbi:MAG: acyl-CoA dehydrogenase family protein [Flavobacteriaceae bacterium]|nr:acyl-CoA dehydrogenase family protein [Flavobacteriaceae bacterium]
MNFLSTELQNELKKEASQAEKTGRLTDRQLEIIHSQKLFNIFVPESFGGLEFGLIEGLLLEEEIAKIDGSLGWTVTLCSGASVFVGYLSQEVTHEIFSNPKVCFGGSGKIGGIAKETEDGYIISGRWRYATGISHCTIFTANCQIEKDGELLVHEDGSPVYKSFFFIPEEVTITEDWSTMGLIATASHSFEVQNLKVDKNRCFMIEGASRTIDHLIFQYPFTASAVLTLAVNHLGIQEHFLESAQTILDNTKEPKYREFRTQLLEKARQDIMNRRELFFSLAQASWEELERNGEVSEELMKKISILCKEIAKKGREAVLDIYPYLGISASDPKTEVNRIIRDILTASQHSYLL